MPRLVILLPTTTAALAAGANELGTHNCDVPLGFSA